MNLLDPMALILTLGVFVAALVLGLFNRCDAPVRQRREHRRG
ncbi:MAG TPA: hypothetical protein VMH26_18025 [Burkholderiales bacterium]|nr:hypothetical protein [Burkholderiales bacterium]